MRRIAEGIHAWFVHGRRVRVLAKQASEFLPRGAHVLDVGTGDGLVAAALLARRPDLRLEGLDVLVREKTAIPVTLFEGHCIPRHAASVDAVMLFDVLHHADDPAALLAEAARVARSRVIIKDHVCDGAFAHMVLSLMDDVGNRRHGVALPNIYWSSKQWSRVIADLRLEAESWTVGGLGLYPWPASLIFGGRLHVMASFDVSRRSAEAGIPELAEATGRRAPGVE